MNENATVANAVVATIQSRKALWRKCVKRSCYLVGVANLSARRSV